MTFKVGNSAQASQLWLQMTPDQRAKFERGEDIRPSVSNKDVQQAIDEHYSEQDDDGSAPKHVDLAPPGAGAGLQDLPSYLNANGATGAPQPAPGDLVSGHQADDQGCPQGQPQGAPVAGQ